jgi:hypothetical protein
MESAEASSLRAHNPEVAGSNPAPATAKGVGNGAFRVSRPGPAGKTFAQLCRKAWPGRSGVHAMPSRCARSPWSSPRRGSVTLLRGFVTKSEVRPRDRGPLPGRVLSTSHRHPATCWRVARSRPLVGPCARHADPALDRRVIKVEAVTDGNCRAAAGAGGRAQRRP